MDAGLRDCSLHDSLGDLYALAWGGGNNASEIAGTGLARTSSLASNAYLT
jgi:hypothetical protein